MNLKPLDVNLRPLDASTDARAPEYNEADRKGAQQPAAPSPGLGDAQPKWPMPASQARQGVTGHNVRYVLGFGIVGIVLAFIIVYLIYFG